MDCDFGDEIGLYCGFRSQGICLDLFLCCSEVARWMIQIVVDVVEVTNSSFAINVFQMLASFWPRRMTRDDGAIDSKARLSGFEREGDKMYLAAEVLQGRYGPETDIFSFGMMMLETATNIVVPTQ